jgi:hypothetical protein
VTPSPTISDLANDYETKLTTFQNDTTGLATDDQKIAALQAQRVSDATLQQTDGAAAFSAGATLISALQAVQATLPQPVAPPNPPDPPPAS